VPQWMRRFGIGQTAKVGAVLYALMGLVFLPLFLIASCALYNFVAALVGGIEVELDAATGGG
jgi:hypothetical protein